MLEKHLKEYLAACEEQFNKNMESFHKDLTASAERNREKVKQAMAARADNALYNAIGKNIAKFLAEKGPMTARQIYQEHPSVTRLSQERFQSHLDYGVEHGLLGLRQEEGETIYFAPETE